MTTRTYLPDILEEHLEQMDELWCRWLEAIRSSDVSVGQVAELEERILAHLSGVTAVGEEAVGMLTERLAQEERGAAFAGARGLLELRKPDAEQRVLDRVRRARGPALDGVRWALSHGPISPVGLKVLRSLVEGPDEMAVVAAEALAYQGQLEVSQGRLLALLESHAPAVRAGGWRLIGATGTPTTAHHFAQALRDEEAEVRTAAMEAGAWCGVPGVLVACRKMAEDASREDLGLLELLAALGTPEDLPALRALVTRDEMGPERFRLAASFGHPELMDPVLDAMEGGDGPSAAAAGLAFERMTGRKLEWLPAEDRSGARVPDAEEGRMVWASVQGGLGPATRICHGANMDLPLDPAVFAAFDMLSRRETFLRSRYHGAWQGSPLALSRFPQGR